MTERKGRRRSSIPRLWGCPTPRQGWGKPAQLLSPRDLEATSAGWNSLRVMLCCRKPRMLSAVCMELPAVLRCSPAVWAERGWHREG